MKHRSLILPLLAVIILMLVLTAARSQVFVDGFEGENGGGGTVIECHEIDGFSWSPIVFVVNLNQAARTYEELFGPFGAASNTLHVRMGSSQYASLPMTVPESGTGSAFLTWEQLHGTPDQIRVSVSPCKGPPVADAAVPQTGSNSCFLQSNGSIGGFGMVASGEGSASIECVLPPGQYFLNFGWIAADGGKGCDDFACTWNVQEN